MTHAKPTPEELRAVAVLQAIVRNSDGTDSIPLSVLIPHLRLILPHIRLQPSPPSVPVDRDSVVEEAAQALDILSQHYRKNYGDVGVAYARASAMVRSLKSSPATGKE